MIYVRFKFNSIKYVKMDHLSKGLHVYHLSIMKNKGKAGLAAEKNKRNEGRASVSLFNFLRTKLK